MMKFAALAFAHDGEVHHHKATGLADPRRADVAQFPLPGGTRIPIPAARPRSLR